MRLSVLPDLTVQPQPIEQFVKNLLLVVLAVLLTACAEIPLRPADTDANARQAWQIRQQALSSLQAWNLTGRIAIQAGQEGWHAALDWSQYGPQYDIKLSTPLGQEALHLQGDEDSVVMRTGDGAQRAENAETLLYNRLGWRIPVNGLRFWVLGLPDPDAPAVSQQDSELDAQGRLIRLSQSGWEIDFRRYVSVDGIDLPNKIFLTNRQTGANLEVRLVIQKWQINAPEILRKTIVEAEK